MRTIQESLREEADACANSNSTGDLESLLRAAAERLDELEQQLMPGSFGWALQHLEGGGRVRRRGWNGKGMWLALQRPDAHSKMSLPYIYMSTADGKLVPWLASQTDMLANDWEEA